jgi:predicted RNase H-like HicB family nuclease
MSTAIPANYVATEYQVGEPKWNPESYRCHLAIVREDDGTFSVIVLNLPGAGSCGDTEQEAIVNTREAVSGIIHSYRDSGVDIPWACATTYTIPDGAKQKWILVDV